jgi:hypothetical protein
MCRLSWNQVASTFWNALELSRPVMGLFCLLVYLFTCSGCWDFGFCCKGGSLIFIAGFLAIYREGEYQPRDVSLRHTHMDNCRNFLFQISYVYPGEFRVDSHIPCRSPATTLPFSDADSHISCCSHAVPLLRPCHSPMLIHTYNAVVLLRPSHSPTMLIHTYHAVPLLWPWEVAFRTAYSWCGRRTA